MTKTLEQAEIDQGVGEGVEIGDGIAVAEVGTFNAESDRLAIDAFGGRALFVNIFVDLALPVERITQASANAGGHGNSTAPFASASMMNRTRLFDELFLTFLEKKGQTYLPRSCSRRVTVRSI